MEEDQFKGDEKKNVRYQTMFDTVLSPRPSFPAFLSLPAHL